MARCRPDAAGRPVHIGACRCSNMLTLDKEHHMSQMFVYPCSGLMDRSRTRVSLVHSPD